jgi:glycosyltransferase involved in cell wall biosynthesis
MITPDVSVVVPTIMGREAALHRAIRSIRDINLAIEVIVVSTNARFQPKDFESEFPSLDFNFILHDGKGNAADNRNQGIAAARGRYVAFLDDDDEFVPYKLEIQSQAMSSSGIRWSFSNYYLCRPPHFTNSKVFSARSMIRRKIDFSRNCAIATPTVMIERSLLDHYALRFDDSLSSREDIEFWARLLEKSPALYIPKPLAKVNRGERSAYQLELQHQVNPSHVMRVVRLVAYVQRRIFDYIDLSLGRSPLVFPRAKSYSSKVSRHNKQVLVEPKSNNLHKGTDIN